MQLNFQVQGEGVPLIILHGLLGSSNNWRAMSKRLAEQFKVYCLDLRNHGASPHSKEMTYDAMADDGREFCASEHIHRGHFIGHSMGGKIAMQLAADQPQSIASLVIVDIAPRDYAPTHGSLLRALSELDLANCKSYGDADRALAGRIADRALRQFLVKNLTRGNDQSLHWRFGLAEIIENYNSLNQAIVAKKPITMEICFLRAGRSDFVTDEDIAAIRQMFPQSKFVTIAAAGHWLHIDAAEAFYQTVIEFLGGSEH